MAISQYTWFKAMDSTKWVRLPMDKTLSKNRITFNIWFKAMDSTVWVCLPIGGASSNPIRPALEMEKQSAARPVHPEPQKTLSDSKPLEKEAQSLITAAKDAEIERIWAGWHKKRAQEAPEKPTPQTEPEEDHSWDEWRKKIAKGAQKKPAPKTTSKREAMPIKIWVA